MPSESTAVATVDRRGITALLQSEDAKARIEPMLRGIEYKRVIGEVYLACGDNPEILQCTPASVIRAVARACSWGLAIGETVHLVPFNVNVAPKGQDPQWEKRAKPIQDYKGKIELIVRCGAARSIDAQVVYEKEPFEYGQGTEPFVRHRPAKSEKDRGALIGVYAIADHGFNRRPHVHYMTLAEVDTIRQKHSKQWKGGPVPTWYMKKTAVHQLAKLLPKTAKLEQVLKTLDEDEEEETTGQLAGQPVATVEAPAALPASAEPIDLDDKWIEEQERPAREPGEES